MNEWNGSFLLIALKSPGLVLLFLLLNLNRRSSDHVSLIHRYFGARLYLGQNSIRPSIVMFDSIYFIRKIPKCTSSSSLHLHFMSATGCATGSVAYAAYAQHIGADIKIALHYDKWPEEGRTEDTRDEISSRGPKILFFKPCILSQSLLLCGGGHPMSRGGIQ